ncbi:protein [Escherichia coli]|nr:protein [Escherichia coli]
MKNCLLLGALLMGFTGVAMAQSVTVDVPSGYKVVVVPDSVSVPQAVSGRDCAANRLCGSCASSGLPPASLCSPSCQRR